MGIVSDRTVTSLSDLEPEAMILSCTKPFEDNSGPDWGVSEYPKDATLSR